MGTFETIHLITTSFLVGVIWIIQLVHYPTFRFITTDNLGTFHKHHTFSITPIVAPAMIIELCLVSYLIFKSPIAENWLLFSLVIIIWLSTFLIQVPIHDKLSKGFDQSLVDKLIKTNWIRTICWTAKLIVMIYLSVNVS